MSNSSNGGAGDVGGKNTPAAARFVLVPFFAPGHMIPMVDLGMLLARRGARVSLVVTPDNARRVAGAAARARASGHPIHLVELPMPFEEIGLPEGVENIDATPMELMKDFVVGLRHLSRPLELHLRQQQSPTCFVADYLCGPWVRELAASFAVPRLTFQAVSCFTLLAMRNCELAAAGVKDDDEPFAVPGLPHEVVVTKRQTPAWLSASQDWEEFNAAAISAELAVDGMVANSFEELEPEYARLYEAATGKAVWRFGPLSLFDRGSDDMAERGNAPAAIDPTDCLRWLDGMEPGSVVFVSFGSMTHIHPPQLVELGLGLEASGHPFLWVIKEKEVSPEVERWVSGEQPERKGMVIRGWAPQAMILSHPAIGGFMTHCGWNSTMEGIAAGVPLITWPNFADQFLNEAFVVVAAGTGVSVGVKDVNVMGIRFGAGAVDATREEVERAVRAAMDVDVAGEGEERRKKAAELARKAKEAMQEGGSSYESLTRFIELHSINIAE